MEKVIVLVRAGDNAKVLLTTGMLKTSFPSLQLK